MTARSDRGLNDLHAEFLAGTTTSMPLAGMICWAAIGIAGLWLTQYQTGMASLWIMAGIMPLAWLIDRMRGRNLFAGGDGPLDKLFFLSIAGIGVTVPLVVIAADLSGNATLLTLGMAILAGVIWIPYGWAADDRVGLIHAIGRAIGSYAAFFFTPQPYTASAICAVVVLSYIYSLIAMKRPPA